MYQRAQLTDRLPMPQKCTPMTDAEAYSRWIDGDRDAGGELIDRHTGELVRWLTRRTVDVDDAVQATWEAAMRSKSYAGRGHFQAWLRRVAASQLRRGQSEAIGLRNRSSTSPSRAVLRGEIAVAADDISHDGQRIALRLALEGHEPAEIAAELGVPVKTVRSRMRAATQKLRERLGP